MGTFRGVVGGGWCCFVCTSQGTGRCGSLAFPVSRFSLDQRRCGDGFRRSLAPLPVASPSKAVRTARYPRPAGDRSHPRSWVPLLEFLKDRPSIGISVRVHSRLPEVRGCHTRTRSALVVPPDFGGLLRTRIRGFVAPRSRSWGSPGFLPTVDSRRRPTFLRACHFPFEALRPNSRNLSPGSVPPRRWSGGTEAPPFLDLEALIRSEVSDRAVLPRPILRASLGFPRPWLSPERCPCWGNRPALRSLRTFTPNTLLGAPRPRLPADPVAPMTRRLTRDAGCPHSGRCARRGHLPVRTLAGTNRGVRDGDRISHGHLRSSRTTPF